MRRAQLTAGFQEMSEKRRHRKSSPWRSAVPGQHLVAAKLMLVFTV